VPYVHHRPLLRRAEHCPIGEAELPWQPSRRATAAAQEGRAPAATARPRWRQRRRCHQAPRSLSRAMHPSSPLESLCPRSCGGRWEVELHCCVSPKKKVETPVPTAGDGGGRWQAELRCRGSPKKEVETSVPAAGSGSGGRLQSSMRQGGWGPHVIE
jgi:hypothetical protein